MKNSNDPMVRYHLSALGKAALSSVAVFIFGCSGDFQTLSSAPTQGELASASMAQSFSLQAATPGWTSTSLFPSSFTVTFDAVPTLSAADGEDAVIGLSSGMAQTFSDLAAIVRFGNMGIDVRNGATYRAASIVPYTVGSSYHFEMNVDLASHTYSVYVTPAGVARLLIANGYSFRTEQAGVTNLAYLSKFASLGGVVIGNVKVVYSQPSAPSPTPVPTPVPTPKPSPAPTPAPTPSLSSFPNASNTGVPAGVTLTPSGGITVNTAGTIIDAMDIKGTLYINANNVTVKRSRIRVDGYFQVRVSDSVTGVIIQDCEVDGVGTNNEGSYGIMGPATSLRNNIHHVENAVTPNSGSVIQDNYVHDLVASGSPHYDGIQIDGGISNIIIRHNTIINANSQTSAVMIDNYFGPISNIVVDNNRLIGGGYTVYSDAQFNSNPISGVSFTNNRLGKGIYGYVDIGLDQAKHPVGWTGNVDDITGQPIP